MPIDTIHNRKIFTEDIMEYEGERLNIKQIYRRNRKKRGRSKYLLSVEITLEKDGEILPARIVCVRNKSNRKDWLALISTDMELS